MTRNEAISYLSQIYVNTYSERYRDALGVALFALRPISREQVEKVWKGEWLHDPETGYECCKKCRHTICLNDYLNGNPPPFCEFCGSPMTDEAVQMVMEKLEKMKDDGTDN